MKAPVYSLLTIVLAVLLSIPLSGYSAGHTVSISSSTNVSCNGGNNGSATATVSGGVGPFSYAWAPSGGTSATATGLAAGTYTVTATDNSDMSTATATVTITQPTLLTVGITKNNVSCNGGNNGTATANVSGGVAPYAFNWNTAPMQFTPTATGLAAGTYTVTVTDANGCVATNTVNITQPTALSAAITVNNNATCNSSCDGTLTGIAAGGTSPYTYSWATAPVQTTAVATGLCAGVYTVTITDFNGCTASQSAVVSQPTAISLSMSSTPSACGNPNGTATVNASGGTPGYTFSWAPSGGTAATATGLLAGVYTVTVTDANSCAQTATVTVGNTAGPAITIGTVTNVSCNGGNDGSVTVMVSGGTAPYTYSWSPTGGNGATAIGLSAGNYTITVTDANGCITTNSVLITQPPAITSSTTFAPAGCSLCDGTATVTASGGTGSFTYLWNDPSSQTTATATNLCPGTYTVTITDANGCTSTNSVTVTQSSSLTANPSMVPTCSQGCSGNLSVAPSGGTAPYTYLWMPGGQTTAMVNNLCAGTYTVTVTDAMGCVATATISLTSYPSMNLTATATPSSICPGGSSQLMASASGAVAYSWSPAVNLSSTTTPNPVSTPTTTTTYTVMATDAAGCVETNTVTVVVTQLLTLTPTVNNATCFGLCNGDASVTVTGGTAPYSYVWSPGGQTTPMIPGLCAGNYTVQVTDNTGCTDFAMITVNEPPQLVVTMSNTDVTCFGNCDGTATASPTGGTPPYTYLWSTGGITQTITNLCAGAYSVTVTDGNGCTSNNTVTINQPTQLTVTTTATIASCTGSDGTVTANGAGGVPPYTYLWTTTPAQNTQTAVGLASGFYTITLTDANGCTANDVATVIDSCGFVWPGDADEDLAANNNDILAIGLAYGFTGPVRPNATLTWIGQPAPNWSTSLPSGVNHKYADCNGDGVVDNSDTVAVTQNYGNTHTFRLAAPEIVLSNPNLYLVANVDSTGPENLINVDIMLGTAAMPIDSIYGLAYTLEFDPTLLHTDQSYIDYTGSWLGTVSTDMITFSQPFHSSGYIDAAVTGIDHINRTGYGKIATFKIVTTDNLSGVTDLALNISNARMMTTSQSTMPVNMIGDTVVIDPARPGAIEDIGLGKLVSVYPNPAANAVTFAMSGGIVNRISITDITGRYITGIDQPGSIATVDLTGIPAGVYQAVLQTSKGNINKKIIVVH
jgi:large repetitive protein